MIARPAAVRRRLSAVALAALLVGFTGPARPTAAASCQAGVDTDGDGLTCVQESIEYGTDVNNPDTDGDGLSDGDEIYVYGTDPLVYDAASDPSARPDWDGDGLYDDDEWNVYFTDSSVWDTDGDGVDDGAEVYYGTDPLDWSSFP